MNWLPPPEDFRGRLAAAARDPAPLAALAALANTRLSFLETLQLDAALARAPDGLEPARLALLASGTVDHLLPGLRVAGLRHGLRVTAHAGRYGQYRQELLDPGGLKAFRPDAPLTRQEWAGFAAHIAVAREAKNKVPQEIDATKLAVALRKLNYTDPTAIKEEYRWPVFAIAGDEKRKAWITETFAAPENPGPWGPARPVTRGEAASWLGGFYEQVGLGLM